MGNFLVCCSCLYMCINSSVLVDLPVKLMFGVSFGFSVRFSSVFVSWR